MLYFLISNMNENGHYKNMTKIMLDYKNRLKTNVGLVKFFSKM